MHGYESFFIANADGSAKTIIKRGTAAGTWEIGTLSALTDAQMHAEKDAMVKALSQTPGEAWASTWNSAAGGHLITFSLGALPLDPSDDTAGVAGLPPWSRAKAQSFVDGVVAYIPLP